MTTEPFGVADLAAGRAAVLPGDGRRYAVATDVAALTEYGGPVLHGVAHADLLRDRTPEASPLAVRFARRFWPGGVHVTLGDGPTVACPESPAFAALFAAHAGPLFLVELDDPAAGPPATVVRVDGMAWHVTRPGVIAADDLRRQAGCLILFLCTGNTCRSPMVQAVAADLLAERLGCHAADLPARGYWLVSAGLAAGYGSPAAPEAVDVCRPLGLDLTGHTSRPLDPGLLYGADVVIAMTRSHLTLLPPSVRADLLAPDGSDLADPIGGDRAVYESCLAAIRGHVAARLATWFDGAAAPVQHPAEGP